MFFCGMDQAISILVNEAMKIEFDVSKIMDFGSFSELKDLNVFKNVHINFDTIEWNNGLDIDPEYLHEKSEVMRTM